MDGLKRVRYFDGQLLATGDFQAEQDYQRETRFLRNRYTIGAGVVGGLEVTVEPGGIVVSPGMAVDRLGREIYVMKPTLLAFPSGVAPCALLISFSERTTDLVVTPGGGAPQDSRIEEGFTIICEPPGTSGAGNPDAVRLATLIPMAGTWIVEPNCA